MPTLNQKGHLSKSYLKKLKKKLKKDTDDLISRVILKSESYPLEIDIPANITAGKVIVEAAHIYADCSPNSEHKDGAKVGAFFSNLLNKIGCEVEEWLLIDNIPCHNPEKRLFDLGAYLDILKKQNYRPTKIIYEESLKSDSEQLLNELNRKGQTVTVGPQKFLKRNNIALKDGYGPKCALLDATFYVKKLKKADYTITVLPDTPAYRDQQTSTKGILKALGVNPSKIVNVFFDSNKEIKIPNAVDKSCALYFQLIPLAVEHYFKTISPSNVSAFLQYCKNNVIKHLEPGKFSYYISDFNLEVIGYVC